MPGEPTRRELKTAIEKNSKAIAENRTAINANKRVLDEVLLDIKYLKAKSKDQSEVMASMVEAINIGFSEITAEIRDMKEELRDHNRKIETLYIGQNENRYRLDGHDSDFADVKNRVKELENRAS